MLTRHDVARAVSFITGRVDSGEVLTRHDVARAVSFITGRVETGEVLTRHDVARAVSFITGRVDTGEVLTRHDVARAVSFVGLPREEPGVVPLLDHHKGDGWAVLCTGVPHAQARSSQLQSKQTVSTCLSIADASHSTAPINSHSKSASADQRKQLTMYLGWVFMVSGVETWSNGSSVLF